jgi:hypothetical protein
MQEQEILNNIIEISKEIHKETIKEHENYILVNIDQITNNPITRHKIKKQLKHIIAQREDKE